MPICPRSRSSEGHKDQRRTNWKVGMMNLVKCPECGELMMPHRVCRNCGTYNKKGIVRVVD